MYGHENLSFYWRNSYPQSFLLDFLLSGYFYICLNIWTYPKKIQNRKIMSEFFFCSLRSQNMLKIAKICRKYVKYLKYVIFLKNGKICKNIFFTYLHILFESNYYWNTEWRWRLVGKTGVHWGWSRLLSSWLITWVIFLSQAGQVVIFQRSVTFWILLWKFKWVEWNPSA